MFVVLPFASFLCLLCLFNANNKGWRQAWIKATLVTAALIAISTELLGAVFCLTQLGLILFWSAVVLVCLWKLFKTRPTLQKIHWQISEKAFWNVITALIPALLAAATLVIALVAPPNNTDSMVYHMSRVAHWAAQHSLIPYATNTLRELYLNPFAEYAILHTYLLSGSDRFVNIIQWFSYINVGIIASLIAEKLRAGKKGQYITALFALSLPEAILQSTSTQNDLTLSCFVLLSIYWLLNYINENNNALLWAGAAIGLTILTKSTSFLVLAPFVLWAGVHGLRVRKKENTLAGLYAMLLLLALVTPFYLRNFQTFGNPLGPSSETKQYNNDEFGVKALASNTARNLFMNFTYTENIGQKITAGVASVDHALGIEIDDPATTWQGYNFSIAGLTINEDLSGAPIHIVIVIGILLAMLICRKKFSILSHGLALSILIGFLIFSAYLKWQPWNNRLELAFFLLAAPLVGLVIEKIHWIPVSLLALGLGVISLPYFLFNPTKPLTQDWNIFNLPRVEMMIRNKYILGPYVNSIIYIKEKINCDLIGMDLENGYWEYPLWNMLVSPVHNAHMLEHINVTGDTASLEKVQPLPCAILQVNDEEKTQTLQYHDNHYKLEFLEKPVAVYLLADQP
jgi:4-amino-4-deoxy-L-arabinose transferase and related glycosyltransferases of PMT family